MKRTAIVISLLFLLVLLGTASFISRHSTRVPSEAHKSKVDPRAIPSTWETLKHEAELRYEVRYPSNWRAENQGQGVAFIRTDYDGSEARVVSIEPGLDTTFGSGVPMVRSRRISTEYNEYVTFIALEFTNDPDRTTSDSYNMKLLDNTPETLRIFELMAASFRFSDYE